MKSRVLRGILSLFTALILALCALLPPASALAAEVRPKDAYENLPQGIRDFIDSQSCDQFTIYRDSNNFVHNPPDFPDRYEIEEEFLDRLKNIASADELKNMEVMWAGKWKGSCYGIASTMILNRLTQNGDFNTQPGLLASDLRAGAEDYYDIISPSKNQRALSWINYYMYAWKTVQRVSSGSNNVLSYLWRYPPTGGIYYAYLSNAARMLVARKDAGKPTMVSFGYTDVDENGKEEDTAHAIVCCDYLCVWDDSVNPGRYLYCFKLYDENDRGADSNNNRGPKFHYIMLEGPEPDHRLDTSYEYRPLSENCTSNKECIYIWRYSDYLGRYERTVLTTLQTEDTGALHTALVNIGGASPARDTDSFDAASGMNTAAGPEHAKLVFEDVGDYTPATWNNYYILPYAYNSGPGDIEYSSDGGCLKMFDGIRAGSYMLFPVDWQHDNEAFKAMESCRYMNMPSGGSLDLEIKLKGSGRVFGLNDVVFDGYSIQPEGDEIRGVSLSKGSQYASVSGGNIEGVYFSSDGRLRDLKSKLDANGRHGENVTLYFGTNESRTKLDMLRFKMRSFNLLQVFDTEDNPEYRDCVVMRTDGLADGFEFLFYSNELTSDAFKASITKGTRYVWIKIQAFEENGRLGVRLWTQGSDNNDDSFPAFSGKPDFESALYKKTAGGGYTKTSASSAEYERREYRIKDGAPQEGQRQADGSLVFTVDGEYDAHTGAAVDQKPLQRNVDYKAKPGSTVVTLMPEFLAALADGTHTLDVYFTDGRMRTQFTTPLSGSIPVSAAPDVPATGGAPLGMSEELAKTLAKLLFQFRI